MVGVQVTQADQREDFRRLVRAELPRLYAIARSLVGADAEDAVQDCMVKAFECLDQLRDPAAAAAWLRSILVNCCRDRGRARARQPVAVDFEEVEDFSLYRKIAYEDPFPYSDSLHLDFLQGFGPEDVRAVLLRLPEIYRVALVLVYMHGFLAKEAAAILRVPLGTVLARLHRGRKLFEKQMWDYAEENGLLKEGVR
ncbi:RNA polymerase sigma factor RpoE [Streptomyces spinoverrucosus]|uniref:RNA polymerase sigma factor RpoE n=1 Tax=Streptomyces spinoverrucosus TaxID=284043 RepID=A0A4Y3VS97_9ACTN|nr:RNA polymerase sigma factor RpoE [Streptomyces spinoverrucosus]GHB87868.1 RNA polymerase sigma factor RpoE [Streptomyces spinoverrucosus]